MTPHSPAVGPLLLTSREAAQALSISERTLYTLRRSGALRAVSIGLAGVRYSVDELRRFIASREAASAAESDGAA